MNRTYATPIVFAVVVILGVSIIAYVAVDQKPFQTSTTLASTPTTKAYSLPSMPRNFGAASYQVDLVYNGTGYDQKQSADAEGYQYLGFATVFNVTNSAGVTQTVPFFWNTPHAPTGASALPFNSPTATASQPTPANATAFNGSVVITWTKQGSTFLVTFLFGLATTCSQAESLFVSNPDAGLSPTYDVCLLAVAQDSTQYEAFANSSAQTPTLVLGSPATGTGGNIPGCPSTSGDTCIEYSYDFAANGKELVLAIDPYLMTVTGSRVVTL